MFIIFCFVVLNTEHCKSQFVTVAQFTTMQKFIIKISTEIIVSVYTQTNLVLEEHNYMQKCIFCLEHKWIKKNLMSVI